MSATERPSDRNVEAVRARLCERSERGIAKYGTTTERGDLSHVEWLRHLQEELLDGAVYIEAAIARTLDAAPADPVVSAECWRRAIAETFDGWEWPPVVEQRAVALAREGK